MNILHLYFKELQFLKLYSFPILAVTALSYSVYFFLDEETIAAIGDEDRLFEWMSSLNFLLCSIIFFALFRSKRNLLFLLLSAVFFFGFAEEISWGQRIFDFKTPEVLYDVNMQKEFNFHNMMTWEVNFSYKLFTLMFGIALPFCVFHNKQISKLSRKLRIPVPPVTLGIFFLIDWLIFKIFLEFILHEGFTPKYYFALTEIYEFVSSFVMLLITVYLLRSKGLLNEGTDIKEYIMTQEARKRHEAAPPESIIVTPG